MVYSPLLHYISFLLKIKKKKPALEPGRTFRIPTTLSSRQFLLGNPGGMMLRRTTVASRQVLWREVPKGGGKTGAGQGQSAGVLRLSGRALAAHPDHQYDRVDVCDRAAPDHALPQLPVAGNVSRVGVQSDGRSREVMAQDWRRRPNTAITGRRTVQGWHPGAGQSARTTQMSRLTTLCFRPAIHHI